MRPGTLNTHPVSGLFLRCMLLMLTVFLVGCLAEEGDSDADPIVINSTAQCAAVGTPAGDTWTLVNTIFSSKCNSCHPGAAQPSLDRTTLLANTGSTGAYYVVPNDQCQSLLYLSITNQGGVDMSGFLQADEAGTIGAWINAGALDN